MLSDRYCVYFFLVSIAITCGHPGNPTFGFTQGTQFNLNDIVRFACNTGYVLQGAVKSHCQSNGQWSNTLPKCKSKSGECTERTVLFSFPAMGKR